MTTEDTTQLALFAPDEVAVLPAPEIKSSQDIVSGWVKARTPKKHAKEMMEAVETAISSGASIADVEFLLSRKHLFPSASKFTLQDLRAAWRHLRKERLLAEHEGDARRLLAKWGERSTVSAASLAAAETVVARALAAGEDKEKIKYALEHRTLLASRKKLDAQMLVRALERVEVDKAAGHAASELFQVWYDRWYKGRYAQPPGQIMPIIKQALLADIPRERLAKAMENMGRSQQVFTIPAVQFAVMQVQKAEEARQAAGAHADLLPQSDFNMMESDPEEEFFTGDFGKASPW